MRRLALSGALPIILLLAAAARAQGGPPQIVDPAGDAKVPRPGLDIVSVGWATTGTTTKVKVQRRVKKVYTPTAIVITMKLAGAVETTPGASYWIVFTTPECGGVELHYFANVDDYQAPSTADNDACNGVFDNGTWNVAGNALVYRIPLKLATPVHIGSEFSQLRACTDLGDPLVGYGAGWWLSHSASASPESDALWVDVASTGKTWKVG